MRRWVVGVEGIRGSVRGGSGWTVMLLIKVAPTINKTILGFPDGPIGSLNGLVRFWGGRD